MNTSEIILIIGAIGLAVVNALGVFVQMITAWRASDKVAVVAQKLEEQRGGNEKMVKDISEIHTNTNGNLSKLNARLERLEQALADKTAELAESKAHHTPAAAPLEVTVVNTPSDPVPTETIKTK